MLICMHLKDKALYKSSKPKDTTGFFIKSALKPHNISKIN